MLKDVIINMHSVQGYDQDHSNEMEFSTDGVYTIEDGVNCISYMESEITGMKGTRTSVLVMSDSIVVDRDGTINSRMIFKEGQKCSFLYNTPFGSATMGIRTRKISQNLNDNGGKIEIDYVMDMDHAIATKNKFTIEVKNV